MSKFKVGDKVKIIGRDYSYVGHSRGDIVVISSSTGDGAYGAGPEGHDGTKLHQGDRGGSYTYIEQDLELVESVIPEPKFKVGDRVIADNMAYANVEFEITQVVSEIGSYHGDYYYRGDPNNYGAWEKYLTLAPRAFREGDLIRAERGESVIGGRLEKQGYAADLRIPSVGWGIDTLKRDDFTITLVEAAPEPKVDPSPLPTDEGLYISQAYSLFRLLDGVWTSVGSDERVNLRTLKSGKHYPLGLVAEPVDK